MQYIVECNIGAKLINAHGASTENSDIPLARLKCYSNKECVDDLQDIQIRDILKLEINQIDKR